jgi:hypothetical protein
VQEFVVQADVTTDGAGACTITVYPPINWGQLTTTNAQGQSVSLAAYQTVDAEPGAGVAINVLGTELTTYHQDIFFHKEALALAVIAMDLPETAMVKSRVVDPDTGFSMTMKGWYDGTNDKQSYRVDALWGVKAIYPELGARAYGETPES